MFRKRWAQAERERAAAEEDRRSFSFGVQMANEAMLRVLMLEIVAPPARVGDGEDRLARIRGAVEALVAGMLQATETSGGLEVSAAADVVDGIFDDPLAERAPDS